MSTRKMYKIDDDDDGRRKWFEYACILYKLRITKKKLKIY